MRGLSPLTLALVLLPLAGCMVGPQYKRPARSCCASFKEASLPPSLRRMAGNPVSLAIPG